MPVPDANSFNVNAIIKPFQWPFLQRYQEKLFETATNHGNGIKLPHRKRTEGHYLYVFGNLMSQGGPCTSKRLPFRIVAGVWCLAAFVFVQAYNSTLFTFLVTPMKHSLINSPYDIPERQEVQLLAKNATKELYKKLGERLNSFKDSRCYAVTQCISMLTPGSNNVYLDAFNYHKDIVRAEFKKTKKCNLEILAKDGFSNVMGSFALPKHSDYTKTVNQGLLEIMQAGLVDYWDVWFRPMPPQCQGNIKSSVNPSGSKTLKMNNKPPALTISNLTGAFAVLLFGLGVSFLVFLCELIISISNRHNRLLRNARDNSVKIVKNARSKPKINAEVDGNIRKPRK
ncbi:hypothetical protein DAPPUDRAFT_235855 [Daphnia pulex]|uniref:Ionotropic glutamate receptor C-terminal domain-containing protein n=1 Tax=Daphnia pulex TaxID=6669 RepID=E9FZ79_DAPPU|nr:hypothetical protein DAPPUDRAFT_235855 [Daphnia pulex]|eukprot:EFX87008.1 hypothetical protein DAPPUDRAFT_235855 [Daphnia pulex]